jgi:hypothetical protein
MKSDTIKLAKDKGLIATFKDVGEHTFLLLSNDHLESVNQNDLVAWVESLGYKRTSFGRLIYFENNVADSGVLLKEELEHDFPGGKFSPDIYMTEEFLVSGKSVVLVLCYKKGKTEDSSEKIRLTELGDAYTGKQWWLLFNS